jgi:hypothetical protein
MHRHNIGFGGVCGPGPLVRRADGRTASGVLVYLPAEAGRASWTRDFSYTR